MMSRLNGCIVGVFVLALVGCSVAPSPFKGTWTAIPPVREGNYSFFKASLTPQKIADTPYYSVFLLNLENTSGKDLIFDWNTSRYLYDGKPKGKLVFEGIDPAKVKTGSVPLETIAPNGRLERRLMPMQLIAWNPIKEKTRDDRGITPGMLPAGENGVLLSFRKAGVRVTIPLTVLIAFEKQP